MRIEPPEPRRRGSHRRRYSGFGNPIAGRRQWFRAWNAPDIGVDLARAAYPIEPLHAIERKAWAAME